MPTAAQDRLTDALIDEVADRLTAGKRVRRTLPPRGRLHIDRQLPYLFVYRPPAAGLDQAVAGLITGKASYLIAPDRRGAARWTRRLVERISKTMAGLFGGFLIVEIWAGPVESGNTVAGFTLHVDKGWGESATVERLAGSLRGIRIQKRRSRVAVEESPHPSPSGSPPLLPARAARDLQARILGIEIAPIHRDPETGTEFPLLRRSLTHQFDVASQRAVFEYARSETASRPLHYHALGRSTFVRAVRDVDRALSDVAESFDLLLAVTPVNAEQAFRSFQRSRYEKSPVFRYAPRTVDPTLLKRALYDVRIERIEDPTLEALFREKQRELELKLSLLGDRETPRFLPASLALYGGVGAPLVSKAASLAALLKGESGGNRSRTVASSALVTAAEAELERYRVIDPSMEGRVVVRDDLVSLMVSSGNLLVGAGMRFPIHRVEPLIQHEVGTHVLTYWNGRAQPFRLLASGLANHDELQEGLAVFTEYLVGGLTPGRLRTLAGRVLAAHSVVSGAEFIETFRLLRDDHGFSPRTAYMVAMRVHRGGGFIKDAVYLRGLVKVRDYVMKGGRLETLFVGKIAADHAPVVEELLRRRVLVPPPLRPTYLDMPDTHYRLERVRSGITLEEMTDT